MDSVRPDPIIVNPNRLLPEDDKITFEISKKEPAGPPETSASSSVTEESSCVNVAVDDDDNDGFKTPVNQIPVITECPPAPKKTRMPLRKRKARNSPISSRKRIQIKLSEEEFDALFQCDFHGKFKKGAV